MELKTARLTLLIDANKKAAFEQLCAQLDITPSQVVRQLIRDFLAYHGVSYVPSGAADKASPKASSKSPANSPAKTAQGRRGRSGKRG